MKGYIPLHKGKGSAEERARLDREQAIVTAKSELPRPYRFINGLGTVYRVEAHSALEAAGEIRRRHHIPFHSFEKLQVVENGAWVYVI